MFQKFTLALAFLSLLFLQVASAQFLPSDSVITHIEVDQLPRSDSVSTPAAVFDARGNFAIVWVAYEKGLSQILLRYFDAIGRPLTEIRPITDRNDTLQVAHPHLAFTPEGFLWLVWDQTTRRQTSQAVAQILNRDFKPVNKPFPLEASSLGSTTRPQVVCDANGRVIAAWVLENFGPSPAFVLARFFNSAGAPGSDVFPIDQSGDNLGIGERLDLAVSSKGMAAITWHGLGDGGDRINLRLFDNPGNFTDNKKDIAARNVAHPTLAFLSADELIVQWYALERTPLLRAQRFDLNGGPVAPPFEITALDTLTTPVVVAAFEQALPSLRAFVSFWSQRDAKEFLFSEVFGQAFLGNQQPITKIASVARTPNFLNTGVELESAVSAAGNHLVVFTGNDRDRNSASPRIGARLTQVALPDLQIASLEVSPANPKRADSVVIKFSVLNAGTAPAAASTALVEFINAKIDTPVAVSFLPANGLANYAVNMGTLAPGNYTLRVTLDHTREIPELRESNNQQGFPFKVEEAPRLVIEPEFLDFMATFGQTNPAARILTLRNAGSDTVRWRVAVDQPWLLATPPAGAISGNPEQVTINVNTAGLTVGSLQANLFFVSNGGEVRVPVTLTINPLQPSLFLSTRRLEFAATQSGSNPPAQNFTVQNRGSGTLIWSATSNQPWLNVNPGNGTTTLEIDQIAASVDIASLLPGSYAGKIFVNAGNSGNDSLAVTLNISPRPPALEISPTTLNFVTTEGTSNPPAQTVYIRNTGGGTLEWSVDENVVWISPSPRSGQTRTNVDSIRVIASISAIGAGNYSATFTINSNGGAQIVRANFTVNPRPVFPDLVIQKKTAKLEDCYTPDFSYVTEFVIYNLGDGAAGPAAGQIAVNNQILQTFNVPALNPGETFNLNFAPLILITGPNTIRCEVDTATVANEIVKNNNSVVLQEWVPQRGDANLDSLIDLRDLVFLVDLVLERIPSPPRREIWAANLVVDTTLNLADVVTLIDNLLSNSAVENYAGTGALALHFAAEENAQTRLTWRTDLPLRAWRLQLQLSGTIPDRPLQATRAGPWQAHWKIQHNVLSLLLAPALDGGEAGLRSGEMALPLRLEMKEVMAASGLSFSGAMIKLEARTILEAGELPKIFSLSPAFPNPLQRGGQRVAEWRFALPEAAAVTFKIFNLLGQEIRQVSLGWRPAGRGQWQWDGRDRQNRMVASGVYFVEFNAGSFKKRERLLLR